MCLLCKGSFQYILQPLLTPGFTSHIAPLNHSFIESHCLPDASLHFLLQTITLLPFLTTSLKFHVEKVKKWRRDEEEKGKKSGDGEREGREKKGEEERRGIEVGGWEWKKGI